MATDTVTFDVPDDGAIKKPAAADRSLVDARTLTTVNLFSATDFSETPYVDYVTGDMWTNFTVVTFPAIFTNTCWRGMNLNGIAVHDNPWGVIWDTTYAIATVVFFLCATIDMLRQFIVIHHGLWNRRGERPPFSEIWRSYVGTEGYRSSLNLGWKFFLGVVGWTVGYEIVAGTHQLLVAHRDSENITHRAWGAAIGTSVGLWIAVESIHYLDYFFLKPGAEIHHRAALGVAAKGFWEGFFWSVIADHNLFARFVAGGYSLSTARFLDSFIVGLGSSPFFTLTGVLTSTLGYWYLEWYVAKSNEAAYDAVPGKDTDDDAAGATDKS